MFWKKKEYMNWNQYANIVHTWNTIHFSQQTRMQNVKNMPPIGVAKA